jgi:hypothetical protein
MPDLVGDIGANIVKYLASLAGGDESWSQYAGDPRHPMAARIGSAVGAEVGGVANNLQTFMGPMYGEGHVPQFGTGESGADYAGAGIGLASMMGGPGGEAGVGAGWNPGAFKYLDSLTKQKPALKPETAAAVQQMISKGPEWTQTVFETSPAGTPGKGYAALSGMKHLQEEMAKPPPVTLAEMAKPPQPSMAPKPSVAPKLPKPVSSTPLTAEQALGSYQPASQADMNQLFGQPIKPLQVPTMLPYNPDLTGKAALPHETAPGTSGQMLPFNPEGLPMDQASVMQRMKEQGFAPIGKNWLFWRGIEQHGPYSWDSAAMGYKDPSGKTNEPGLFLAPDTVGLDKEGKPIASMYGPNVNAHVVRSDNPLVIDWEKASGGKAYDSSAMQKVIKDTWDKGNDAVLLKNIVDIGGKQDQLVVKSPNQLRHPHAAFNPKFKDTPNLLAARGGMGVTPWVVPQGDDNEQR